MCFSAEISLKSFIFGITSGILLMLYGKKTYSDSNYAIGIFFMFVSLMQYIEYLIWIDLKCENTNKTAGIFGYLFNYLQPTVFFILSTIILNKTEIIQNDKIPLLINIIYFGYILIKFNKYKKGNLCSKLNNGNLEWSWRDYDSYFWFHIVTFINILYYQYDINMIVAFIASYILMFFSKLKYYNHVGEIWCLLSTSIPGIVLAFQQLFI